MTTIHIICNDGSPLGVTSKTVWGDDERIGVGGAELGLITMCEEWTKEGYEVVLYNDPYESNVSPFEQRDKNDFDPGDERDVLITFRSPNPRSIGANGLKVWWSTDQYTQGDFAPFAPFMDKIVCISEFHQNYFDTTYEIRDTIVIDLPVRIDDFVVDTEVEEVQNRMIFTSIPDRGLENLWRMYPLIKAEVPDVSLVITSDYRLWGADARNEKHRVQWVERDNIQFLGAVRRAELIQELMKAQLMFYPCTYEELFCISVAEAGYAGIYPITPAIGSLETTNMGTVMKLNPHDLRNDHAFVDKVVELLSDPYELKAKRTLLTRKSYDRFRPEVIVEQWDEKVFA